MDLISIVVPVYNAEDYVARCLESIIHQSYQNIEIIIVDDGSTDSSFIICQDYEKNDDRVILVRQDNQGVSAARNTGLKRCRGKYVFFVDSDDWLLPEFIEHYLLFPDTAFIGGGYLTSQGWKKQYDELEISTEEYRRSYMKGLQRVPSIRVTGNRYKRSVIVENALEFETGINCGEDTRFNAHFFRCIDKLVVTNNCEYCFTIREDSLSHRFIPNRFIIEKEECQVRQELFLSL